MNRFVIALTLAAFPIVATAQQKTQAVTVTNPVVAVEVRNANPVPVVPQPATVAPTQLFTAYGGAGGGSNFNSGISIQEDVILTGLLVDIRTGGTSGVCSIVLSLVDASLQTSIVKAVGHIAARGGEWKTAPFIPLPNIAVPKGTVLAGLGSNSTGETCTFFATLHGLKN